VDAIGAVELGLEAIARGCDSGVEVVAGEFVGTVWLERDCAWAWVVLALFFGSDSIRKRLVVVMADKRMRCN
jgi:hypothetical protein